MATTTKAKPKAPAKAKAAPKGRAKATKSTKAAAKPKAPTKVLETGTFVTFNGYNSEVEADEAAFEQGQTLYIVGSEETEDGVLYLSLIHI